MVGALAVHPHKHYANYLREKFEDLRTLGINKNNHLNQSAPVRTRLRSRVKRRRLRSAFRRTNRENDNNEVDQSQRRIAEALYP